jgi:Fe-S cluster assembly ATP-binding protein
MKMLQPKIAILDEIDSGLDVDALRIVGENINAMKSENFGALIITHYERFVDYIDVDKVSVLAKGVVKASGGLELLKKINEEGFDWLLDDEDEEDDVPRANIVGTCAFNDKKDN